MSRVALCALVSIGMPAPVLAQSGVTRVSVAADGAQAIGASDGPAITPDGRYVVFASAAANLVDGDTNGVADVFLRDRQTGTIERISIATGGTQALGGGSMFPAITPDGRFVAFGSDATNLVIGDTNGATDVFVRDRQTATTTRATLDNTASQFSGLTEVAPAISADGRYVAFGTTAPVVGDDTNGQSDVYLRDRQAGTTVRVSVTTAGMQTSERSAFPAISANGRFVAFTAFNPTFQPSDTTGADVFVRDVQGGTTTRVSVGPSGVQGNGLSIGPSISEDGRFVAFSSLATNFEPSGGRGIFVHDRQSGVTSPVRLVPGTTILALIPLADQISGDGRVICYTYLPSIAANTILFAVDRQTLTSTQVSVTSNGTAASGSSYQCAPTVDGTTIAFTSTGTDLVAGDTNGQTDVFVRTSMSIVSLDKTAFKFSAVTNAGAFTSQTPAQTVRLTQSGNVPVTWTAVSNQPWLHVSPVSGTGSATLTVSVAPAAGLPPSGTVTGAITVSATGAANVPPPVAVSLTLVPAGASAGPFGNVDSPTNNRTGVAGAVPFTGWALDDIEVTRVSICRAAFGSEVAPVDPNCGGATEIFVGFGVFIDGARPDVAAGFPTYPLASRGGWGFMLLTNMLPNQGNGPYFFRIRAQDREGHWSLLGTRTMTCANASATLPFGTIDTPLQDGTVSGSSYVNFGWALTPQAKTIPVDGSTIQVLVDGVSVGTADYNHARPDIQAAFPGYTNTDGAVGFRILDTTALTNGLHTLSWTVTDDQGAVEGIGSRFFTVANDSSAVTAASTSARAHVDVESVPADTTPLVGRRGWDLEAPYGIFEADANGVAIIRSEEVSRIELQLGAGDHAGYLRTSSGLAPLPVGSRLDAATNTFTWAPGVGFIGRYDLVFVRSSGGRAVSRREVRVLLQQKSRGSVGPQVVIDAPAPNATVREPFLVGGWAADLSAVDGTGVSTLHAWAYPASGGAPIFLGATVYGGARPDVAAAHGASFKDSGFGLIVQGVPAGAYDLALFAWSTETMGFVAPKMVRVNVTP